MTETNICAEIITCCRFGDFGRVTVSFSFLIFFLAQKVPPIGVKVKLLNTVNSSSVSCFVTLIVSSILTSFESIHNHTTLQ